MVNSKSAVIFTWNGFQDQELVYPYYRLKGAGYHVETVADSRDEKGRIYGILGVNMPCEIVWDDFHNQPEAKKHSYDLLVLPGGVKSLEKLRQDDRAVQHIAKWGAAGKPIASTCHGAQLLISAGLVKGRVIAGYYSLKVDIENAGGKYSRSPVEVDGNIVSSPHYDFMGEWMEAVLASVPN